MSADIKIDVRSLQYCEQFYSGFHKKDFRTGLNWSHYRYLLTVSDKKERQEWMQRCLKGKWSSRDLSMNILLAKKPALTFSEGTKLKSSKPGVLYTYRLISVGEGSLIDGKWMLDCGFANRIETPSCSAVLQNKYFYTSIKADDGYRLKVVKNIAVSQLYTYQAQLMRVVDGDTIVVMIDQGFGLWTQQKLRLKGIDTPEMTSSRGRKAKQWVEKELSGLELIVVKTYKSDKYGRYLADIFYCPNCEDPYVISKDGKFLNQELLDKGLAEVYG